MNILVISLLLIALNQIQAGIGTDYTCNHDLENHATNVPPNFLEEFEKNYGKRLLQSKPNEQPIRLTFDFTQLSNAQNGFGMNDYIRNYIINIVKAAQRYFRSFIKVIPRTKPIKSLNYGSCGNPPFVVHYPPELQGNGKGIENSDLHILVTYYNDKNTGEIASAGWCDLDPNPIIGRIRFNLAFLNTTQSNRHFQDNFVLALHELTHVMGFSNQLYQYWIDPQTGKPYGVDRVYKTENLWGISNVFKIITKNVVKTAKNHYACPYINGMFLENQGGSGSKGSHWEKDLIRNEYMAAQQILGGVAITEFTAALLRDTGFYSSINSNVLNPLFWGKNKGCEFYNNTCKSYQKFAEFPKDIVGKRSCDFYQTGSGVVAYIMDIFSQCPVIFSFQNQFCSDPSFQPDQSIRQNPGPNSFCLNSNLAEKGVHKDAGNQRCHKIKCNSDFSQITIYTWQDEYVTCKYPGQAIDVSKLKKGVFGTIFCPLDFEQTCTFPQDCPNLCSSQGVCMNGYCICVDGYAGIDCSYKCPFPTAFYQGTCVQKCPANTFKNPDNTCKQSCPQRYFPDQNSFECVLCHSQCSSCFGELSTQCYKCNLGFELQGNSCVEYTCDPICGTCNGSRHDQCTSCYQDKTLIGTTCVHSCNSTCKTCVNQNDPNSCLSCFDNYYLKDSQCLPCPSPCGTCQLVDKQIVCNSCNSTSLYRFDSKNNICIPICYASCLTCNMPLDKNSCVTCKDGFYLSKNQCLPCSSPCLSCENNATTCLSCINNTDFIYDSINKICKYICKSPCTNCDLTKDTCTSCIDGYYLDQVTCKKCKSPCKKCTQNASKCTQCIDNYVLNDSNQCINLCDQSCATCSIQHDKNACITCNDGYTMINSLCLQCKFPCSQCIDSQDKCTECAEDYELNGNICKPGCSHTCKTCSKFLDKNGCTSCREQYFLQSKNGIDGRCFKCNNSCKSCKDSQTCETCFEDYQISSNGLCTMICDQSCLTCSRPKDSNACLTCKAPSILVNNFCEQCKDGFFYSQGECKKCSKNCKSCENEQQCSKCEDGYKKDSLKGCVKQKCHFSCKKCVDNSYDSCITCQGNRELIKSDSSQQYGVCQCPELTTDTNQPQCSQSHIQSNIKKTVTATFTGSVTASIVASSLQQNPLMFFTQLEFSQSVSYLTYVNYQQPVGFDQVMKVISYSSLKFDQNQDQQSSNQTQRILENQTMEIQNQDLIIKSENPKLRMNNQSTSFLKNSFIILIIQGFAWSMSVIAYLIKKYIQQSINMKVVKFIVKIFYLSIPLILFIICSQQMWICIFYEFNLQSNGQANTVDFVSSVCALFYMFCILAYLFYKLEYKKCLKNIYQTSSAQTIQDINIDSFKISYLMRSKDNFYFIYKLVKQDSFMTRNVFQFIVIVKMIISLVSTFVVSSPYPQIATMATCYFGLSIYLVIFRPFKLIYYTISLLAIYVSITIISIIYAISINYEDDPDKSKGFSIAILVLVIGIYAIIVLASLILLTIKLIKMLKHYKSQQKLQIELKQMQKIKQIENANLQQSNQNFEPNQIANNLNNQTQKQIITDKNLSSDKNLN
ncbi:leishmanolysin family protein (macronuclear) [Tetrahymena thermophila SB210]|uniref:Leishmanolysin family protein n=1 Tax=Tetrahymena thermophila (strain SB210) TaxID=312017 RepID=Q23RP1_TETTS|nr:leishmanolysin family protein [Tetrahymena thermophila SB210]EAR99196.2 leishmanolysin family protein [Tetrahymena thermophila SB210]|eukprot:XP_001019441.2 leishmanolysin family protein [Tetrahymena thermophila SB210]